MLTKLEEHNHRWFLEIPKSLVSLYKLDADSQFKVNYNEETGIVRVTISKKIE